MNTFCEVKGNLIVILPVDVEYSGTEKTEDALLFILMTELHSKIGKCQLLDHHLQFKD